MKGLVPVPGIVGTQRWPECPRWWLSLALLGFLALNGLFAGERSAVRFPDGEFGRGRLRYVNGLPVLEVEGSPEEIAKAVAQLTLQHAEHLAQFPRHLFLEATPAWLSDRVRESLWQNSVRLGQQLLANIPERHQREYQALQGALPEKYRDCLVAGNTLFDIKRMVHCSAVIVGRERVCDPERDLHGPILGRNLDFPTLGYLHQYTLVLVYKPQGKFPFVAVGFPGVIGVLSGMNVHGLCVAMLEVYESKDGSPPFNPRGIPYAVCLRSLLEECRTVKEAHELLTALPRTCYYNVAVCDQETGGVLEVTPKQVVFRPLENGLAACTNHFCSEALAVRKNGNSSNSQRRLAALLELSRLPRINLTAVQRALHQANQGHLTLQTLVFEPAQLRLYIAVGQCPSSALPLVRLEARPWLTGSATPKR